MLVMHHGWTEWDKLRQWHKCTLTKPEFLPVTVNCCSHFLCYKAVKGAIKTSLLTADCHQQFATSPKQPYSHFLNGFNLPDYPVGLPNDSLVER